MKLYEILESQLKKENNFISDNGELKKWVVINKAQNYDSNLISLILENKDLKNKFFINVNSVLVFNQNLFIQFLEQKNYLNDSYTKYQNKVGLTINDKYIKQRNEVSLVWPFKDCILEGGQSKEEDKREEIFFNEVLAQDEITQLFEPKIFTNAQIFNTTANSSFKSFSRDSEINIKRNLPKDTITDNLIIKGNNLLALHSLKKEFTGKVKLIYIDPPFNTGKDEFKYNDNFNHSTWLTFMKNRLTIAKELLSPNGSIVVQVGNEEASYIQVLLDDIFKRENYLNHITMSTNAPSGFKATSSKIFSTSNHIYIYAKDSGHNELNKIYVEKEYDTAYKYYLLNPESDFSEWKYCNIVDIIAENEGFDSSKSFRKTLSKENLTNLIADFALKNKERVFRTAAVGGGALKKRKKTVLLSKKNKGQVMQHPNEDVENFFILNGEMMVFWSNVFKNIDGELKPAEALTDIWTDIGFTGIANEGGVTLKNGKKPELLLKRIIELTTNANDIVLDYHMGSGTTCAVAHKINRQYIGIEQLDYGKNDSTVRLNNVISGDSSGISKLVNWKGGGSFIYLELKKHNQNFIELIQESENTKQLLEIWDLMKLKSFLNYNVDIKKQEHHINDFMQLDLKKQKEHLVTILDKNQLYVNISSMNDKDFEVTQIEKMVTSNFYQLEN
ncbi:DNA methyltransferase [Tenacibaculum aestuarii]|uniref:DNA methyltransferase n=1 Tax=Tenacibaculum aestuarii TaxID=362781 RepID=UPI00389498C6